MSIIYTSTDAAMRRERRRQKILCNATERISTILAGPEGKDSRSAPAVEISSSSDPSDDLSISNAAAQSTVAPSNPITMSSDGGSTEINYVEPQYAEHVNHNRIYLCLMFGAMCRLVVLTGHIQQVMPVFAALFVPLAVVSRLWLHEPVGAYPKHGYIVNCLLVGGWNERLVVSVGHAVDAVWEMCIDLLAVMFAYMLTTILWSTSDGIFY